MIIDESSLSERLRKAMDVIEKNPNTSAEVFERFKEFVESVEDIAVELKVADTLRGLLLISHMN